jgi:hypothetical protein
MSKNLDSPIVRPRGRPLGNVNYHRLVAIIASQISAASNLSGRELEVAFSMGDSKDGYKGRAWRRYRDGEHGMNLGKLIEVMQKSAALERKWLGWEWHSLFCPDYFAPYESASEVRLADAQSDLTHSSIESHSDPFPANRSPELGEMMWEALRKRLVEGDDKFNWKIDANWLDAFRDRESFSFEEYFQIVDHALSFDEVMYDLNDRDEKRLKNAVQKFSTFEKVWNHVPQELRGLDRKYEPDPRVIAEIERSLTPDARRRAALAAISLMSARALGENTSFPELISWLATGKRNELAQLSKLQRIKK